LPFWFNRFFEILGINTDFLDVDVSEWASHHSYMQAQQTVASLPVVNDHAERAVRPLQDYNKVLTRSEEQLQGLLHTVSAHRKSLPDVKKTTLNKKYSSD